MILIGSDELGAVVCTPGDQKQNQRATRPTYFQQDIQVILVLLWVLWGFTAICIPADS